MEKGLCSARDLLAQLVEVMMADFIDNKTQHYVHHYADRLGQMRAKKIADHICQSNGQCQGGKSAHADNPAVKIQMDVRTTLKT